MDDLAALVEEGRLEDEAERPSLTRLKRAGRNVPEPRANSVCPKLSRKQNDAATSQ